jgi:hypothetical protein
MSAVVVVLKCGLFTVLLFAGVPADSFEGLAAGAVAGGSADVKVGVVVTLVLALQCDALQFTVLHGIVSS